MTLQITWRVRATKEKQHFKERKRGRATGIKKEVTEKLKCTEKLKSNWEKSTKYHTTPTLSLQQGEENPTPQAQYKLEIAGSPNYNRPVVIAAREHPPPSSLNPIQEFGLKVTPPAHESSFREETITSLTISLSALIRRHCKKGSIVRE